MALWSCHFQHVCFWFGSLLWLFFLNSVTAALHIQHIWIFQCVFNIVSKTTTNKCMFSQTDTLVEGDAYFMLHVFFDCFYIRPSGRKVSVWKGVFIVVPPPPDVEIFLMSFHFLSVFFCFLNCMSKGVRISGSFSCFSHVRKDTAALPQSNAIWQWCFFIFWNFSSAKSHLWSRFQLEKVSKSIRLSPITTLLTVLIPEYFST